MLVLFLLPLVFVVYSFMLDLRSLPVLLILNQPDQHGQVIILIHMYMISTIQVRFKTAMYFFPSEYDRLVSVASVIAVNVWRENGSASKPLRTSSHQSMIELCHLSVIAVNI